MACALDYIIDNIAEWAKANQGDGFKIYLWTDVQVAAANVPEQYSEYIQNKHGLKVEDHTKSSPTNNSGSIYIKDVNKEGFTDPLYIYLRNKLKRNWGELSDIMRKRILAKRGGTYLDCPDVAPGKNKLAESKLFDEPPNTHILGIDYFPQAENITVDAFNPSRRILTSNDALLCTQANPILIKARDDIAFNFELDLSTKQRQTIRAAYAAHDTLHDTINRTGAPLIYNNFEDAKKIGELNFVVQLNNQSIQLSPLRSETTEFIQPKRGFNTSFTWLATPVTDFAIFSKDHNQAEEIALNRVISTIKYEMEHFKTLRLDSHIDELIQCLKCKDTPEKAINLLINRTKWNQSRLQPYTGRATHL